MKVYLIRHAQSEENVLDMKVRSTIQDFNELVRRSHESPLTREGEIQTRIVVEKLTGARIERLYSSPFVRTLSTATAIGEALDLTPQLLDDLREVLPRPMSERRREAPLKRLFVRGYVEMLWPWGGVKPGWNPIAAPKLSGMRLPANLPARSRLFPIAG